jgi:hypothetical protein
MISNPLTAIQKYLAMAGAFLLAVGLAVLKGMSIQKNKTKLAQKDIEFDSYKAVQEAREDAKEVTDENSSKTDSGDWTGFNR